MNNTKMIEFLKGEKQELSNNNAYKIMNLIADKLYINNFDEQANIGLKNANLVFKYNISVNAHNNIELKHASQANGNYLNDRTLNDVKAVNVRKFINVVLCFI